MLFRSIAFQITVVFVGQALRPQIYADDIAHVIAVDEQARHFARDWIAAKSVLKAQAC